MAARYFRIKLGLLILACCLIIYKYSWRRAPEPTHQQEIILKPGIPFTQLKKYIADDILQYLNRTTGEFSRKKYSVLQDPYYTYQFRHMSFSDDSCIRINGLIKHIICPERIDGISLDQIRYGIFDYDVFGPLLRFMIRTPGAAYIDIGSNVGAFALPMMAALGPRAHIVAVEANPYNALTLAKGIVANGFPLSNWAIINRAVMDTIDAKMEWVRGLNTTNGAVKSNMKDGRGFEGDKMQVTSATIDSHLLPVVLAMNITTAILKIDIEGGECLALQYARKFLGTINVPYIVMEYSYRNGFAPENCLEKMFDLMQELLYYPFPTQSESLSNMLDPKKYKNWLEPDIVWKKIA